MLAMELLRFLTFLRLVHARLRVDFCPLILTVGCLIRVISWFSFHRLLWLFYLAAKGSILSYILVIRLSLVSSFSISLSTSWDIFFSGDLGYEKTDGLYCVSYSLIRLLRNVMLSFFLCFETALSLFSTRFGQRFQCLKYLFLVTKYQ